MTLSILGGIITILATILPTVIAHWAETRKQRRAEQDALLQRNIAELSVGAERVRDLLQGPKPPV